MFQKIRVGVLRWPSIFFIVFAKHGTLHIMMPSTPLKFITSNMAKVAEVQKYLEMPVEHMAIELDEIQSTDLATIVEHKVRQAYNVVKSPVLVEDVGLSFQALGKLPGPFIKWFEAELGLSGICRLLDQYPNRACTAQIIYAFFDGERLHTFVGETKGSVAKEPTGDQVFGWNPIFIPEGSDRTWAEMTEAETEPTSMRKKALVSVHDFLIRYYA